MKNINSNIYIKINTDIITIFESNIRGLFGSSIRNRIQNSVYTRINFIDIIQAKIGNETFKKVKLEKDI